MLRVFLDSLGRIVAAMSKKVGQPALTKCQGDGHALSVDNNELFATSSPHPNLSNPKGEMLIITLHEIFSDLTHEMGTDPGLQKDGVEAHLQELLADDPSFLVEGLELIKREYPTDLGPVDLLCRTSKGETVAVEIKRRGEIDGVEQLTRYLDFLNRDPLIKPVHGIFAAQEIRPQAKVLAEDRGIQCVVIDYDEIRGIESNRLRLF